MVSCGIFNETDFCMIEGSEQTFSVNLYDIFGEEYTKAIIDYAEWRMSKYGETEMVTFKKSTDDSVKISKNIITISISSKDTQGLYGKFTHQLILKDGHGKQFIADLGKISIKPQIK